MSRQKVAVTKDATERNRRFSDSGSNLEPKTSFGRQRTWIWACLSWAGAPFWVGLKKEPDSNLLGRLFQTVEAPWWDEHLGKLTGL